MITIKYNLTALSPILTGTSGVIGKDIDLIMKRTSDGKAYIPGKHLKGILRDLCSDFLDALENTSKDELLKEYFGKEASNESKIRFTNLTADKSIFDSRTSVKLDENGVSQENNLFCYEYCDTGTVFTGEISFNNIDKTGIKLLLAALLHVDFVGNKSKGMGYVKASIKTNEEAVTFENLETIIEKNLNKSGNSETGSKGNLNNTSNLKEYTYELNFEEDYMIKQHERGNQLESRSFAQGTTIRGALIKELSKSYSEEILQKILSVMRIDSPQPQGYEFTPATIMRSKYKEKEEYLYKNLVFDDTKNDGDIKYQRVASNYVKESDLQILKLNKRDEISVAIDNKTKTAIDGRIFNSEYVERPTFVFEGRITIPEEIKANLNDVKIFIGRGKTKGYGAVQFILKELAKNSECTLESRINKFNEGINDKIYTIDIQEDVIIPFSSINKFGNKLSELYGLGKFVPEKSVIMSEILGGYSIFNSMRKSDEIVVQKGSVLVYNADSIDYNKLNELEKNGLGLRTNEGFGKIKICSESHFFYGGAK